MDFGTKYLRIAAVLLTLIFPARVEAAGREYLTGQVPAAAAWLVVQGDLPATNWLHLAIGLPLRNRPELTNLLAEIYRPGSSNYHRYLKPEQFAERFGPSTNDYEDLAAFLRAHGMKITGRHANRTLLDVAGPVSQIEQAFHTRLRLYKHPRESRTFYAPDAEPSLDLAVPVLHISGLDNWIVPHPMNLKTSPRTRPASGRPWAGSAPGGAYWGLDFRTAYVPGTLMTGQGQQVGLLQLNSGFFQSDITRYENDSGLPNVPVTPVLVNAYDGGPGLANAECSLDIEMAIAMAPGLQGVLVYEGTVPDDVLNQMATDDLANQLSSSYGFTVDSTTEQTFQQFAAQGQTFFNASGDEDAWVGGVTPPSDDVNITIVGGTTLTTDAKGAWSAETVWQLGGTNGSGGGISTTYPIPAWQQGVDMTVNQGSTTMRNIPDVALTADNVYVYFGDGNSGYFGGTSCASPLWAGFTALINQQAANNSVAPVGFVNPAIYQLGQATNYPSLFHDIIIGNNTNAASNNLFFAVPGYDLCSGWGTPAGQSLIDALVGPAQPTAPFLITQPQSQTASVGTSVSLSVVAGGFPPPGYQWMFAGTNLLGATNTFLVITNIQASQAGNYRVWITNPFGAVLSSNAVVTVHLQDHFAWSVIPSPRFVNNPFTATIVAQNRTNGLVTGFTGTVALTTSLGLAVQPAISGAFVQGSWTGSLMLAQPATNLVLQATDALGDTGLANPITVLSAPVLGSAQFGNVLLVYWPTNPPGFVVETAPSLYAPNWLPVTSPPDVFGNQYLEAFPMNPSNGFYRLFYTIP